MKLTSAPAAADDNIIPPTDLHVVPLPHVVVVAAAVVGVAPPRPHLAAAAQPQIQKSFPKLEILKTNCDHFAAKSSGNTINSKAFRPKNQMLRQLFSVRKYKYFFRHKYKCQDKSMLWI